VAVLKDADAAKFAAEFGRSPTGPGDELSLRLEVYRADMRSITAEDLSAAAALLPPAPPPTRREHLTLLAKHLKESIFTWVTRPPCSTCSAPCAENTLRYAPPTSAHVRPRPPRPR
jgi:hypothetical protein